MKQPLSFWELWQIEKFGDVLEKKATMLDEEIENGHIERERNDAWMDDQQYFSLTEQAF